MDIYYIIYFIHVAYVRQHFTSPLMTGTKQLKILYLPYKQITLSIVVLY